MLEEEESVKEVITVENAGGKGNPNHKPAGSPDGGQFTSKEETGNGFSGAETKIIGNNDTLSFEPGEQISQSPLKSAMMEFMGKKKEVLNQQARDYMASVSENLTEDQKKFYRELSREEKLELLKNNKTAGYDPTRLKFASDDQLTALLYAERIQNMPNSIEQEKLLLEKAKEDIKSQINEELAQNNTEMVTGIWKYLNPKPSNYKELKEGGSYDLKIEYFQKILENPDALMSDKMKAKQNLAKLKKFAEDGEAYEKLKDEINLKYIDKLEEIELKYSELNTKLAVFRDENGKKTDLVKSAEAFADKFKDFNSAYSAARKNNAVWINEGDDELTQKKAAKFFGPYAEKHWNLMTADERTSLLDYTGSPSKFNEPLRSLKYAGYKTFESSSYLESKAKQMAKGIQDMTDAIDKCTWDYDVWVQRGVDSDTVMFPLNGKKRSINSMTPEELTSLVGTVMTDNGFYSAGAGKDTGFDNLSLILNTYCPKGTKMAYMNTKGQYKNSTENEMILQRGYSYRITKVEHNKKKGKYYVDVEVILGSDASKPVGKDLEKIGEMFYA